MKKIMVIGCGGAGKTTFSRNLHKQTGIPVIHLDQHYWQPNWMETPKDKWTKIVQELAGAEHWIIDGNYGGTMDIRLEQADTVIFLNRSTGRCVYRVIKRVLLNYGQTRTDMAAGCREHFSWDFVKYIWHYNRARRPQLLEKLAGLPDTKRVVILTSERQVADFLSSAGATDDPSHA